MARKRKHTAKSRARSAAGRGRKKVVIKGHTRSPRGPNKGKKRVRVRRHRAYRGPKR